METTYVVEGAHSGYGLGRLDVPDDGEYGGNSEDG